MCDLNRLIDACYPDTWGAPCWSKSYVYMYLPADKNIFVIHHADTKYSPTDPYTISWKIATLSWTFVSLHDHGLNHKINSIVNFRKLNKQLCNDKESKTVYFSFFLLTGTASDLSAMAEVTTVSLLRTYTQSSKHDTGWFKHLSLYLLSYII